MRRQTTEEESRERPHYYHVTYHPTPDDTHEGEGRIKYEAEEVCKMRIATWKAGALLQLPDEDPELAVPEEHPAWETCCSERAAKYYMLVQDKIRYELNRKHLIVTKNANVPTLSRFLRSGSNWFTR